ncbi:MAG TPA: hypothetical protein VLF71_02890 [Candidatus Saccharimonadales bacterium]|nr:hypothetical protein [Candidatus Saccharimonadales bacterium]
MERRGERRLISDERRGMLRRSADGRLRPASEERDIADIWADQKRLRLKQAIEEDNRRKARRAEKQRRREQRKQLGWRAARAHAREQVAQPGSGGSKEIEIRLSLPSFRKLHIPSWDDVEDFLANLDVPVLGRRHAVYAGCVVSAIVLLFLAPAAFRSPKPAPKASASPPKVAVLGTQPHIDQPPYATILPAGKTAQQLGGWGRVSPKTSDPVYAYADILKGIGITVSEQPLPDEFALSPQSRVTDLAKQFNATKALTTKAGTVAYIGTSTQGIQSIVATKQQLLILIRSEQTVPDTDWAAYLDSLH